MPEKVEVFGAPLLNVRTQRGVIENATKIVELKEGAVFEVADRSDGWVKLVLARSEQFDSGALYGWVHGNYVQPHAPSYPSAQDRTFTVKNIVDDLPKHPTKSYKTRNLSNLDAHVVHHSGTSTIQTPRQIANHHVDTVGWPGIGYTFFITPGGEIFQTNQLDTMSYATKDQNHRYLSTVLPGNFTQERPTSEQIYALRWLHHEHIPALLNRKLPLIGHKEGDGQRTACPGDKWDWHKAVGA